MIRNQWSTAISCCFILIIVVGCGSSDPRSIDVSGIVTIKGKPIKAGRISFYPDNINGNRGPAGTAGIQNGKFDTTAAGGKGTIGGPHRVLIENFVNSPVGEDGDIDEFAPQPDNPIPNGVYVAWDIPNDDGSKIERDFDIDPSN